MGSRRPEVTRRSLLRGTAAAGGAVLLGGCASGQGSAGPGPTRSPGTTTGTTAGSTPGSTSGAVTVTDQRGRTVTLAHPAQRVVTLPIPAAAMLIAVDRTAEHLVGMHEASWDAIDQGLLGQLFPAALDVPHTIAGDDFAPNVESILALNPDVVVQWGDHGSEITRPLENAGLKVVGLSYGTQDDVATWLRLFGKLLGKPQRGHQIVSDIDARLARTKAQAANGPAHGPKVLYFLRFAESLEVAAAHSYNDYYIRLVGARNPAHDASGPATGLVEVDKEQVLAWDPDIVLLGNFDPAMPQDMYDDPVWRSLSAVKTRRVYKVPLGGYRWDPPSQESPLMWQWLAQVAFPGRRSGLRDEVGGYYRFLYGKAPTAAQTDAILRLDANKRSAHYDQFDAG